MAVKFISAEGFVKKGKFYYATWEGKPRSQPHDSKESALAEVESLKEAARIAALSREVNIELDALDSATKSVTEKVLSANQPESKILTLVKYHHKLNIELIEALAKVKKLNERIMYVELSALPELMLSMGQKKSTIMWQASNPIEVKLEDQVRASLPSSSAIAKAKAPEEREILAQQRKDGFAWLIDNNAESLIKSELAVAIPRGKNAIIKKITPLLKKLGLSYDQDTSVHPSTLSSFVSDRLEAGLTVPFDLFRVFAGKRARINNPLLKKEKGKLNAEKGNSSTSEEDNPEALPF